MPVLLHIDSSPLTTSVSRELTHAFSISWKAAHPDGQVITRDLAADPPSPIDATWIYAAFTPEPTRQPEQIAALAPSDQFLDEIEKADEIVIGVAMHNFSIPSVLKLWIDQIARKDRAFNYGPNGPEGLLQGKKATILVASGGVYQPGTPFAAYDHIEPYLRTILGFIGITDVTFVKAGGTAQLMSGAVTRESLLAPALQQVRALTA
ncbi:MAG: acyl carrier protein phosphodiesterase [Chthonomonadales bacterium]|nr:acyl carrier protein phosphodiesterase [Chthonomonadales bacterium]